MLLIKVNSDPIVLSQTDVTKKEEKYRNEKTQAEISSRTVRYVEHVSTNRIDQAERNFLFDDAIMPRRKATNRWKFSDRSTFSFCFSKNKDIRVVLCEHQSSATEKTRCLL